MPARLELRRLVESPIPRRQDARRFLVDERFTIADIALYAYTHCADQGGFGLAPYTGLQTRFNRVRAERGHVPIDQMPT